MKNATIEPPGRAPRRQASVIPLKKSPIRPNLPAQALSVARQYRSAEEMVHELRPTMPVHCLRPATIAATAKWFLKNFPGDVLYAVKTNPDKQVLAYLYRVGVSHFDVASLAEIKLVAENAPGAMMYFMHPVKSREAIHAAYFTYGVRDFSFDSQEELEKIINVTGNSQDLSLILRLAVPNTASELPLSGKFGATPEKAVKMLKAARKHAKKLGLSFHVGSQTMDPQAHVTALTTLRASILTSIMAP